MTTPHRLSAGVLQVLSSSVFIALFNFCQTNEYKRVFCYGFNFHCYGYSEVEHLVIINWTFTVVSELLLKPPSRKPEADEHYSVAKRSAQPFLWAELRVAILAPGISPTAVGHTEKAGWGGRKETLT